MSPFRSRALTAVAALVVAACTEDAPTGVAPDVAEIASELAFVVPTDLRERMITRTIVVDTVRPAGPARSEDQGYGTYYDFGEQPVVTAAAGLWDEKTRAWFLPGRLSVVGSHDYIANKSSVDTKATLSYQGAVIGTNQSYAENSHPFIPPPLWTQSIWTEARIYTDRECGLSGWGDSAHRAWWEAVMGSPVSIFSAVARGSTADRVFQPACPPTPPNPGNSTGSTSTGGGGGEAICYLWTTYDLETGEIYNQQLLFCTDGG
ncbi:MAG: hypothetical protein AB7T31_16705 [Gemmatimonadales bacterium]